MSMYRQLWLAIIVSMLLALCGSLLASLLSARAYLEQQLSMKNADNASALALSLSQQNPDAVAIELAVAALFDSGHYASIQVHDPHGKLLIERVAEAGSVGVPDWFVRLLPIDPAPGEAQITNGWTQLGKVTLVSHSSFGYQAVWSSSQKMVIALTLASLVGGYLGSLILRRLRNPLQSVIDQAEAITNRRFVTIPEPDVPELHQLARAMNLTVTRIKAMFEDEAARLDAVRRDANSDGLTGLANRDHLIAELRATLDEEGSSGGVLLLIRVADLMGINRRLGREATDDMLRRVGAEVGASATAILDADAVAARMNGADFALLLRGPQDGHAMADSLLQRLIKTMEPFIESGASAFIGFGGFHQGTQLGAVLSQVDAALIAAEAEGQSGIREAVFEISDDFPDNGAEWAKVISASVAQGLVKLVRFPVVGYDGKLLHFECPLRLRTEATGEWLPAGRFLPVAERLGLVRDLDMAAIEHGLRSLEADGDNVALAINLSATTIADPGFLRDLDARLKKHRNVTRRLWVEVSETGVLKHLAEFRNLCRLLQDYGCRVGVEHFGRQFSQVGQFHDIGMNYVKVDASFVRGIDDNSGNQTFLKGACTIAHSIGLLVIGEGTTTDGELQTLRGLGFDGATGPGIRWEA